VRKCGEDPTFGEEGGAKELAQAEMVLKKEGGEEKEGEPHQPGGEPTDAPKGAIV